MILFLIIICTLDLIFNVIQLRIYFLQRTNNQKKLAEYDKIIQKMNRK